MAKQGGSTRGRQQAFTEAAPKRKKPRRRERPAKNAAEPNQPANPQTTPESPPGLRPEPAGAAPGSPVAPPGSAPVAPPSSPSSPAGAPGSLRVIEPPLLGLRRYFTEVWRHRSAFFYFARRFMRKRYGRTYFGYLWFVIPYILPLFVGALVFGGIFGVSTGDVPYFLYFVVALGTWLLFSQTAYFSTRSLEIVRSDLRRVYVPRLIPLAAAMTLPALAFVVYMVLMAGTLGFYVLERGEFYLELRPATFLVPLGLAMLLVLAWAAALWFSPLAPRTRDVRRMASYALGMWYFLTPVMYPIEQIPEDWQFLASLNPATAPLEMVKSGLIEVGDVTSLGLLAYSAGLLVVGGLGLRRFKRKELRDLAFY